MVREFTRLVCAVFALLGCCAKADVLFWMVDQTNEDPGDQVAFQYVSMVSGEGDAVHYYVDQDGNDTFGPSQDGLKTETYHADLRAETVTDDTLFYFALYNVSGDNLEMVGRSANIAFGDVKAYLWDGDQTVQPKTYTATAFHAVPEPTGGVLALLGVALLTLRRRNEVKT